MKQEQIRDMSADQLADQLLALRKQHMDLRFAQASGQLKSSVEMRRARRGVARIKTEINARARKTQTQKAQTQKQQGEDHA